MKIIGSLLIIISSIIATAFYEKKQNAQINGLKEIARFAQYVKNQIEFFSLPLKEIYEKYNLKNDIICKLINLESIGIFSKGTEQEILNAFSGLGKGFKTEQTKSLDYLNSYLEKEIKELETSFSQKIKVFRAMALFIGCCAIIILV